LTDIAHPHITVLGHSYGSLTVSFALQQLPRGVVRDVVFYGAPGIRARAPEQLGLEAGHVYAMQARGDMIRRAGRWFGGPVVDLPWVRRLSTTAGVGPGDGVEREGACGHADYSRLDANGLVKMSGYNMACVLAGHPELAVYGE
jgi:pimeloyl-ACP methyl ester carboxylesterase